MKVIRILGVLCLIGCFCTTTCFCTNGRAKETNELSKETNELSTETNELSTEIDETDEKAIHLPKGHVFRTGKSKILSGKVSKADGNISGHGYVDLGLPSGLKWATMNVGASSPEENGNYYGWSETTIKSEYLPEDNIAFDKDKESLCSLGVIDDAGILTISYDAAHANWGGSWRMPTDEDFEELKAKCRWIYIFLNDSPGWKVVGPNGNSIFFPTAGIQYGTDTRKDGDLGYYWCATVSTEAYLSTSSGSIEFGCGNVFFTSSDDRASGRSVRAVSR